MRIIVVSDSHLSPAALAFNANWRAVRAFVASAGADLTIHLGDVTVDGFREPEQFIHARELSASWSTPIRFLPGNHDIGDNPPGPGVAAKEPLQTARLTSFRDVLGPDYWALDADAWRLIALNAQLIGSDTAEEAAQWSWLRAQIAGARDRPTVLVLHKPLFQESPRDDKPHHRYVPAGPRRDLFALFAATDLRAVVSGHTHQYRDRVVDGLRHVWVPSTAYYLPDEIQERIGEKVTGLGVLDLGPRDLGFHLVCPDGVARHSILEHPVYPDVANRPRLRAAPAATPS
jgi:3',5'-cyclic AMP phosphodiesterase CpdA